MVPLALFRRRRRNAYPGGGLTIVLPARPVPCPASPNARLLSPAPLGPVFNDDNEIVGDFRVFSWSPVAPVSPAAAYDPYDLRGMRQPSNNTRLPAENVDQPHTSPSSTPKARAFSRSAQCPADDNEPGLFERPHASPKLLPAGFQLPSLFSECSDDEDESDLGYGDDTPTGHADYGELDEAGNEGAFTDDVESSVACLRIQFPEAPEDALFFESITCTGDDQLLSKLPQYDFTFRPPACAPEFPLASLHVDLPLAQGVSEGNAILRGSNNVNKAQAQQSDIDPEAFEEQDRKFVRFLTDNVHKMNDKVLEAHIIIHSDLSDPNSYAKASPSLKKRVHTLVKDFPSLRVDTLTPIEPLYKCIFPECDVMVGGKREAARTHVESHHWPRLGNAPFPPDVKVACPACPMDSKNGVRKPKEMQIQNLGRHMADKHFCSSLLKCKVCDKQVARADRFPKHFRLCYSSRVDRLSGEGPPLKRARII